METTARSDAEMERDVCCLQSWTNIFVEKHKKWPRPPSFLFFLVTTYFHEKNEFLKNLVNNHKTVHITLLCLCYIYTTHNGSALIYIEAHGGRLTVTTKIFAHCLRSRTPVSTHTPASWLSGGHQWGGEERRAEQQMERESPVA